MLQIIPPAEAIPAVSEGRPDRPRHKKVLGKFFASQSKAAYLVGGAVRDALLGLDTSDLDLAVEADPRRTGAELARALRGHWFVLDDRRGIVRVAGADGDDVPSIDLVPLRGGIEADLARRDFTIDAMALAVEDMGGENIQDKVIDPHGGGRDLDRRMVRAVAPGVFVEDPARLMRAPRLAAQLDFSIDERTAELIRRDAGLITTVAPERVRDELLKILGHGQVTRSLHSLDGLGLLCAIIPELAEARGVGQPKEHHWDVFDHSIQTAGQIEMLLQDSDRGDAPPFDTVPRFDAMDAYFARHVGDSHGRLTLLKLAGLLHDISKPATKTVEPSGRIRFLGHHVEGAEVAARVLERLRFSGRAVGLVRGMVRHHLRPSQMADKGELPSPRAIYRFYRELGDAAIDTLYLNLGDYLAARGPDLDAPDWEAHCRMIGHILQEGLAPKAPARAPSLIDGHLIMDRFSLPPGPAIGRLVELVREAQGSGEISTGEEAIRLVESALNSGGSGA